MKGEELPEIKVGMIGTGFAAAAHIEALRRINGPRVVAIAASSQEKAEKHAARFGVEGAFGDYRSMLERAEVDVVHNCTPNLVHLEANLAALDAGVHVLSEKPLAMDAEQTSELVEASQRADVVAGVCFNYRHYPLVREAKDLLATGRYGPAHFVHGGYLQDWLLMPTDWNWRLDPRRAGQSRAVADIGSHWLDNVEFVTGDLVQAVFADLFTLHRERLRPSAEVATFERAHETAESVAIDTEDLAVVALRFASGARGSLTVSQVSAGRKNKLSWEIDTAAASIAWDQQEPNRLWIGHRERANEELMRDPGLLGEGAAPLAHFPGGHEEGWPDGLKNLVIDFYVAVEAKREGRAHRGSFASFADAHHITRVVEAILQSNRSGSWVEVED
jgi:predicted dehydrogenase